MAVSMACLLGFGPDRRNSPRHAWNPLGNRIAAMPRPDPPAVPPTYPGGSKSRVNRAGDRVRSGTATPEDLHVIEEWRAAHRGVLNTFQAILRQRARSARITVAQRHKRKRTIFDKLERLPGMNLARMDDVAGCRLIFRNQQDLRSFRASFHKARFNHTRRYSKDPDKYDYIKSPKETGYRGIHDVYEYDVNSNVGKPLTGLYVEIQYRTLVQHAWATAVEVIGFITESQPKFQKGDKRYEHAMSLASEVLARAYEGQKGPHPELSDRAVVARFPGSRKRDPPDRDAAQSERSPSRCVHESQCDPHLLGWKAA